MARTDLEERRKYQRQNWLMRHYNLTVEEYAALRRKQGWRCAICKRKQVTSLAVDHCHVTGRIRGLLCLQCNRALGLFKDSPELLRIALVYVSDAV